MSTSIQADVSWKPYEAPQVIRFGSIVELTRNNQGSGEKRQGGNDNCNGRGGPLGC